MTKLSENVISQRQYVSGTAEYERWISLPKNKSNNRSWCHATMFYASATAHVLVLLKKLLQKKNGTEAIWQNLWDTTARVNLLGTQCLLQSSGTKPLEPQPVRSNLWDYNFSDENHFSRRNLKTQTLGQFPWNKNSKQNHRAKRPESTWKTFGANLQNSNLWAWSCTTTTF